MDLENLEKLIQKYPNVSREEMEKIRETSQFSSFSEVGFEMVVRWRHTGREKEKINGRESVIAGPLAQLLSVHFLPSDRIIEQNKPLTIYGRIYAEFRDTASGKTIVHELYSRKFDDAQVLGPSDGPLTLTGPDCSDWPLPLNSDTRLVVDVFAGEEGNNLFAEQQFFCCAEEDMTTDLELEKVRKPEYVHGELGSLALRYIAMPFAVYGLVKFEFCRKLLIDEEEEEEVLYGRRCVNVRGKIVARYGGNFPSEACWVGLPAYSSLLLDVDLSEFGTERKLLKETIELRVERGGVSNDELIVDDDIYIRVSVSWVPPTPQGRQESRGMELEDDDDDDDDDESSDDEMLSGDEQMTEASCFPVAPSSNLASHWALQSMPFSTPSVEIFSVFIEDPAQPGAGGVISLSRSRVVVPLNSSLIIEAKLWNGVVFSCVKEFRIGEGNSSTVMEGNDCAIHILLKWDEVSN
ncbi:hypothetical protein PHJA_001956100 [Phtheirospermum japonicum]|uniref:Uncharacterized protein n=1 Tax=Phtheirospermum japonicum TaxID=374723 RepID=A0A830CES7_9LAMI|nr:hypothetical protein PHJA_001956100 [Phtheirospermum japonicum]